MLPRASRDSWQALGCRLREVHLIRNHISHLLLSVVQMASFPKWQSSEIPVKGVWWQVSISLQPQRVTSISLAH